MKNAKKLFLVLAIAVFAIACVACGKKDGDNNKTTTTPTAATQAPTAATTTATPEPTKPARDLKGIEVSIVDWWSGEDWNKANNAYQEAYWEMMNDAMKANNFTFTRKNVGGWGPEYTEARMLEITNNEPSGSIVTFDNTWVASLLSQGAFLDVSNLPSIDWTDKKWNKAAIEVMTINGGIYGFAAGFEPRTGVFFNKPLFKQFNVDTDLPYQLQAEGKWSWDEFEKLCKELTKDTNNDGITDVYGVTGQNTVFFTAALMTNGTFVITKDDAGKLMMNAKDPKVLEALNWAHKILDEGYFSLAKEGDEWDYFKADFFDGEAAMWVEEEYAISQGIKEHSMDVGFVTFPYGPAVGKPIAICRENILIIPSCPATKDIADDIAFAYNIYTDVPEGYEDDDARWKASYETLFEDEKAVTETINWIINKYDSYMNEGMLIANFRPDWLYNLGDAAGVPSTILEEYSAEWQTQVDEFNATLK